MSRLPNPPRDGEWDRQPPAGDGGGRAQGPERPTGPPPSRVSRAPPRRAGEDFRLADPAATEAFGARLAEVVRPGDVVTLSGPLGAGKTSIARGLLAALDLAGEAPSPSFAIVQPYAPPEVRLPVLHVDLYRIEHPDELEELGLDEALSDSILLIEWPERAPGRWPQALALTLAIRDDGGRALTADVPPGWERRWPM